MEQRGEYSKPNIRGMHVFVLILLVIFALIFSPVIYSIHRSYKNTKVVTATISDVSGAGGRKINVRYQYEMNGKKYEAERREIPIDQEVGDKEKISVNQEHPEAILDHENEKEALFLIFLLIVILFVFCIAIIMFVFCVILDHRL